MYENLLDLNDIGLENEVVGELDPNELVELEREYVELTHLTGHLDMVSRMVERVGEVEEQIKDPSLSLKEQRILSNSVKRMSSLFMDSTGVEIGLESASLEPALEVASTLKKWWDALMKFLRSIWDKIKSFFKRIFGIEEKVKKETKKKIIDMEAMAERITKEALLRTEAVFDKVDKGLKKMESKKETAKIVIPTMTPPITKTYKTMDGETKTTEVHDKQKIRDRNQKIMSFMKSNVTSMINPIEPDIFTQTAKIIIDVINVITKSNTFITEVTGGDVLNKLMSLRYGKLELFIVDFEDEFRFDTLVVLDDFYYEAASDSVLAVSNDKVIIRSHLLDKYMEFMERSPFNPNVLLSMIESAAKHAKTHLVTDDENSTNAKKAVRDNILSLNGLVKAYVELCRYRTEIGVHNRNVISKYHNLLQTALATIK